jgi:DNA-binding NarL/FixJ family response regulator
MIDVLIADDQELFHIGMAEILAVANDVRIVGQPQSPELLLGTLKQAKPHVLVLSTSFLPALSKIQRALRRRETALLVLAEDNDRIAYTRWLRARGVVYRSMDGPVIVDAMRRVARGELFIQNSSSDTQSSDTQRSTVQSGTTARLVPLSLTSGPAELG